jgi:hypothetical protein
MLLRGPMPAEPAWSLRTLMPRRGEAQGRGPIVQMLPFAGRA